MSQPGWHIAILIPARNEELLLPRCLSSVLAACAQLPRSVTSDIVVVTDCCDDDTHRLAEEMLRGRGTVIAALAGAVGVARAIAAESALERYRGPLNSCWLANTDADCEVPAEWLLQHLHLAQEGFMAVAGIIDVDSFAEHDSGVEKKFRLTYTIAADGRHAHVHGANFGVRADAYLEAGGWAPLTTGEDHALWSRLRPFERAQRTDRHLRVVTSGRRTGRAPHGFADSLAAHNESLS